MLTGELQIDRYSSSLYAIYLSVSLEIPAETFRVIKCHKDYRIAGNFRQVQIFAIFATHDQNAKIKTAKYEKFEHVKLEIFTSCVLCTSLARSDN